jgi:integrase
MAPDPLPVAVQAPPDALPAHSQAEVAAARFYVDASRAASTRKANAADWRRFSTWCRRRDADAGQEATGSAGGAAALPALVAVYLSSLAARGLAPPHRAEGGTVIADVLAGIRRSRVGAPDRKTAADGDITMQLLESITGDDPAALRDRALIALGMALAARRSELVALDVADLAWEDQGLCVTIRRSKTDQEGFGAVVAVPEGRRLTPLLHLRAWLAFSGLTEGPVFRPLWKGGRLRDARLSDHAVARIVQARAAAAGLDRTQYAGHSLRAGFVTAAARAGADIWKIQQVSRHRSPQVLFRLCPRRPPVSRPRRTNPATASGNDLLTISAEPGTKFSVQTELTPAVVSDPSDTGFDAPALVAGFDDAAVTGESVEQRRCFASPKERRPWVDDQPRRRPAANSNSR